MSQYLDFLQRRIGILGEELARLMAECEEPGLAFQLSQTPLLVYLCLMIHHPLNGAMIEFSILRGK
jgi:hypothetical protein